MAWNSIKAFISGYALRVALGRKSQFVMNPDYALFYVVLLILNCLKMNIVYFSWSRKIGHKAQFFSNIEAFN